MHILITGGAGYIGSHIIKALLPRSDIQITIIDDLSTGFKEAILKGELIEGSILNTALLNTVFKNYHFDAIIHLAAHTQVPESIKNPIDYYQNNVVGTLNILNNCVKNYTAQSRKLPLFIFSSSAAVYGAPDHPIVTEATQPHPTHPYGWSKYMSEQVIQDAAKAYGFCYGILRYFNVAGCDPDGLLGQNTPNATLLIKVAAEVACGKRPYLAVYGADYDTPDGSCIRDFIHVSDLANAHVLLLDYLKDGGRSNLFNIGYGHGYSVKQVIQTVNKLTGKNLNTIFEKRRPGDCAVLIADATRAKKLLHWSPVFDNLEKIIETALAFERRTLI